MRNRFAAVAALAGAFSLAAAPAIAAFPYLGSQQIVGGDCAAIAAEIGAAATWVGEFSGDYYDDYRERSFPVSARGCFRSRDACRAWQSYVSGDLGRGGIRVMRCTQGWR